MINYLKNNSIIKVRTTRYQTIDLDQVDKYTLYNIINKIKYKGKKENCNTRIYVKDTFKGYHIIIECKKECDLCRLVFDDDRRYYYDQYRPKHLRNVLWTNKYYKKVKICPKKKD